MKKINKFSLSYLAGMVMIGMSGFFPFLGYRFTMEDMQDVKAAFPLLRLGRLQEQYSGMGEIGIVTRLMPYVILICGIAGIVLAVIYLKGDHDTWDIFNLNMAIPSAVSGLLLFFISRQKTIRAIHSIMKETTESMREDGYSGFAGYRSGYYLLLVGVILSLVSILCFFALDKE